MEFRRTLAPGLVAGLAFLSFEVLAGQLSTTFWAFPQAIAQTVGIGLPTQAFDPLQFAAGSGIHIIFSVGLGMLFAMLADRLLISGVRLLVAAVLFMWAESAISIWLVLHTLFPETLPLLLGAVPLWASFAGRNVFGLVLGFVYAYARTNPTTLTRASSVTYATCDR